MFSHIWETVLGWALWIPQGCALGVTCPERGSQWVYISCGGFPTIMSLVMALTSSRCVGWGCSHHIALGWPHLCGTTLTGAALPPAEAWSWSSWRRAPLSASPAGAERTRRGDQQLRSGRAWDPGVPTRRGAHRGKLCPPTAHPPWSEGAGSGHRSPPFPPCRRVAWWERAELVLLAPSHQGTHPAPLTPAAGPGTGSWWHQGRRRPTAAAEPACRGEPSRGGLLQPPQPRCHL